MKDGAAILSMAEEVNAGFAVPLGQGEVACVARSITRFMVNRWDGKGRHVPMAPAEVKVLRAAGRAAHAEGQRASRDERLLAAAAALRARGDEPGQAAVAAEAGVSLRTVQSAWASIWNRIVTNPQPLPVPSGSSDTHAHRAGRGPSGTALSAAPGPMPATPEAVVEPPPALERLTGGDPGTHSRFMPPRARAALSRHERESWNRTAAQAGPGAYRLDWNARQWRLWGERRAELEPLRETAAHLSQRLLDGTADACASIAASERLRRATMAWASRLAAEARTRERTLAAMPAQARACRFRTARDAPDCVVAAIPPSAEETLVMAVRERATERAIAVRERAMERAAA